MSSSKAPSINSISSVEEAPSSKVKFNDLSAEWKDSLKAGLKSLKRQNGNAKKVVIKGQPHQSSTVAAHTDIISCQLQDANGNYLGSAHIDSNGQADPNKNWTKNLSK